MAKAKLKTRKGVSKRTKITGTGGVIRRKSCKNHRITGKGKTVRSSKSGLLVDVTNSYRLSDLMPYK